MERKAAQQNKNTSEELKQGLPTQLIIVKLSYTNKERCKFQSIFYYFPSRLIGNIICFIVNSILTGGGGATVQVNQLYSTKNDEKNESGLKWVK